MEVPETEQHVLSIKSEDANLPEIEQHVLSIKSEDEDIASFLEVQITSLPNTFETSYTEADNEILKKSPVGITSPSGELEADNETSKYKFPGHITLSENVLGTSFIASEDIIYKCPVEMASLPKKFEASFITTGNKTFKYKCSVCDKKFKTTEKVQSHVNSHISVTGEFKCSHCDFTLSDSISYKLHTETHKKIRRRPTKNKNVSDTHESMRFICEFCAKGFRTRQQLNTHMAVHNNLKQFVCSECSKSFKLKAQLQNHVKIHINYKPFLCDMCEKSFRLKQQLENHRKSHSNDRPFKCLFCEKAFKFKQQLQIHCRVHNDMRPFECDHCEKSFKLKQQLQVHQMVHTNERPFQCDQCEKSFKFKQQLQAHYNKIHFREDGNSFQDIESLIDAHNIRNSLDIKIEEENVNSDLLELVSQSEKLITDVEQNMTPLPIQLKHFDESLDGS